MAQIISLLLLLFLFSCGQLESENVKHINQNTTTNSSQADSTTPEQSTFVNNKVSNLIFKTDTSENEDSITLTIFRDNKAILKHIIYTSDGDCSSVNIELGKYKLLGNHLTFYTYWAAADRQDISLFPFGFRKQVYHIDENKKLTKLDATIYIEDYVERNSSNVKYFYEHSFSKHKGILYLNTNPKNDFELKAKADYIKNIEKTYKAKFALNHEKKKLEQEVRKALAAEIAIHTKGWDDEEAFGTTKK